MNSFWGVVLSANFSFLFTSALFFSIVPLLISIPFQKAILSQLPELFILLFSLTILGGVCGLAGGLSREGVVGDIVPAVLGIAAGLAIYLFGIDKSRGTFSSIAFAAFSLSLLTCYIFGGSIWRSWQFDQSFSESCRTLFFDSDIYKDEKIMSRIYGDGDSDLLAFCKRFWGFSE